MSETSWSLSTFVSVLVLGLGLTPAHALNTRSFISANGVDTNPCTRTAPCRTLQKAHDSTNPGGEINMLDPAGYGTVTITKSISIVNDGVGSAGILVPNGGTGITINAAATDKVNLRGLIIEGAGIGNTGIVFNTGQSLTIEYCLIRNLTGSGIQFIPNASSNLAVSNTFVAHNGLFGIAVVPTGGGVTAVLNRVEAYNNVFHGILVSGGSSTGTVNATVTDSVAAANVNVGIFSASLEGSAATSVMVVRSLSANNGFGLIAQGGAILRVSQSTVTGNTTGWLAEFTGVLLSAGDNTVEGNANNQGAPPTYAKK